MKFYIETERLIMRPLVPEDAEGMFALDSDPEVHRYVGGKPVKTMAESRNVIEIIRKQYEQNGIGRAAVVEKSSGKFIGWCGLKLITTPTNGHNDYLDVGYRFIKEHWGKGYAKETAKAAVEYARLNMPDKEVYGMADENNAASRRVLESAGLQFIELFDFEGDVHAWYKLAEV